MAISCRFCPGEPDPPQGYARAPAARMYTAPRAQPYHETPEPPATRQTIKASAKATPLCMPICQHHRSPPEPRARRAQHGSRRQPDHRHGHKHHRNHVQRCTAARPPEAAGDAPKPQEVPHHCPDATPTPQDTPDGKASRQSRTAQASHHRNTTQEAPGSSRRPTAPETGPRTSQRTAERTTGRRRGQHNGPELHAHHNNSRGRYRHSETQTRNDDHDDNPPPCCC